MSHIIAIHSFRGGTGKSNSAANIAALLAAQGKRVAVVDMDIQSPGIHVLFGLDETTLDKTLNGFLYDQYGIVAAAHDVTPNLGVALTGQIFLVPSSIKAEDISRVVRQGYNAEKLNDGLEDLIEELDLDAVLLDSHPGLGKETLLSLAAADTLVIILRPDEQDFQGTHVTLQVMQRLQIPQIFLVVNKAPEDLDLNQVKREVEKTYGVPVLAVFPHSDEMMTLASSGIFSLHYPDHPVAQKYRQLALALLP
ncbi:MAG: MinD/ParA family protein [Chloroflexi bacterium]|nr:MinD/ParA family protein [Chloroflexota bacterium]MBP8058189.1 MinD/ParA family protein [Chloroflexota bacterium]